MGYHGASGIDFTLPAPPPLTDPPLSLLSLAPTLVDDAGLAAEQSEAREKLASAQAMYSEIADRMANADPADVTAAQMDLDRQGELVQQVQSWADDLAKRIADVERWSRGFLFLPELGASAVEIFVPGLGNDNPATSAVDANGNPVVNLKNVGSNQSPFLWNDPFIAVGRDERSLFGYPATDFEARAERSMRALEKHEAWQVEHEFWTGASIPTNYHLSASPTSPTTSAHRTVDPWPEPTAAPGTVLGTPVGLAQSLAALDQAIADADAGTGMVHATCFMVQQWMRTFNYIRDAMGRLLTVNMNRIVPGYGYPGTGPDDSRSVADGVLNSTTTVTSATAAFKGDDVGAAIAGTGIPSGATIVTVTSPTAVVISSAATATATGVTLTVTQPRATGATKQWAYATDMVYLLKGDARTYPWDLRQGGSQTFAYDNIDVRAERSWGIASNQLLRAAVLIDSTVS